MNYGLSLPSANRQIQGGAVTEQEKMQALAAAGLDASVLSTNVPAWVYPVGALIVLCSSFFAYRIASSG